MRKSFALDSRTAPDREDLAALDAARQTWSEGTEAHRGHAGAAVPEPGRGPAAEAGVRLRVQAPGIEGPEIACHRGDAGVAPELDPSGTGRWPG
jgi:hypothetical protein